MFMNFERFEQAVSNCIEYAAMMLLVLMAVVVNYTVFTRYFLGFTPAWGEETALLCMVWFGFLSLALGVRDNLHLSITILDNVTPKSWMKVFLTLKYLCVLLFSVFMLKEGLRMSEIGAMNKLPGLQITSWWLYFSVPVSGAACFIYSLMKLYKIVIKRGEDDIIEP